MVNNLKTRRQMGLYAGVLLIWILTSGVLWGRPLFRAGEILVTLKSGRSIGAVAGRHGLTPLERLASTQTWRVAVPRRGAELAKVIEVDEDHDVGESELNYLHFAPEALQDSFAFVDQESFAFVDGESPAQFFQQPAVLRIQSVEAHQYATGRGVIIALIDTGVDVNHPALQTRIAPGWDFIKNDAQPLDIPGGIAYGHGTFIAGILALVAPEAKIMPLRALRPNGAGDTFTIAKAIHYAADRGAHVLNLSLGMSRPSHVMAAALGYAQEHGLILIASAGNSNSKKPQYPAHNKLGLAVAAVNALDQKAAFSNYGPYIGVSAPGVQVYSTYPNRQFATWSGTSFATAFTSGEAALIRSLELSMRPAIAVRVIESSADNIDAFNPTYRGKLGEGRINCLRAVRPR